MIITWLENVRQELSLTAEELGVPVRELATTFLCAMIGDSDAVFFQVGDGAIIYLDGDRYCHAFWPRTGDYANTTFFLTDQQFPDSLDCEVSTRRVDEVALITDGLQMLALDYQLRSVHSPFFSPMFLALRRALPADLNEPLVAFLNSTPVTDRTDDDKTLILASRVTADEPLLQ